MLFGQKNGLPAYYRRMPGNISDVVTLKTTIDALRFLGQTKLQFVLDQGFYSEDNVDTLFEKEYLFVLMVPTSRVWVRNIIDQYYETIASPRFYRKTGSEDEVLYMVSHPYKWDNCSECFVHLFYDASRAALDFDGLIRKLVECREELESGKLREVHAELYERFFVVEGDFKAGNLLVVYNEVEIAWFWKRCAGFFCVLTNVAWGSLEVLEVYRRKEVVECCFDDLKNSLDMRRLRVHSSGVMDSRLFVQFLALILIGQIRVVVGQHEKLQYLSPREILEAMESIASITYTDNSGSILSEKGPLQRSIMEAFNIQPKT
jgi:transposase